MKREDVYKLIDGEREYQDKKWVDETGAHNSSHSVADWVVFIEHHLDEAKKALYALGKTAALKEIRKIAALAVTCMEFNETEPREAK